MFLKEDCYRLGSVAKLHSFKGEVSIYLDVDDPLEYKELESVFVEFDDKLIPFFIEKIQVRPNGYAVVKFEDIDNERQAKKLVKGGLYLPLDTLPELDGNEFYFHEIEGFEVFDENNTLVGNVLRVLDLSNNPLIAIDHKGTEVLLPKQDHFILKIDRENQAIHVRIPEGLIEMYLGTEEE